VEKDRALSTQLEWEVISGNQRHDEHLPSPVEKDRALSTQLGWEKVRRLGDLVH
jgi:hypothetical protein